MPAHRKTLDSEIGGRCAIGCVYPRKSLCMHACMHMRPRACPFFLEWGGWSRDPGGLIVVADAHDRIHSRARLQSLCSKHTTLSW